MAKRVTWAAANKYVAENPDKIKRPSDIAELIGISRQDFYSFFRGNRVLSDNILNAISNFFDLALSDVKAEYTDYVNKYISED